MVFDPSEFEGRGLTAYISKLLILITNKLGL